MGKPTGFLEIERQDRGYEKPAERLRNWNEFIRKRNRNDNPSHSARGSGPFGSAFQP